MKDITLFSELFLSEYYTTKHAHQSSRHASYFTVSLQADSISLSQCSDLARITTSGSDPFNKYEAARAESFTAAYQNSILPYSVLRPYLERDRIKQAQICSRNTALQKHEECASLSMVNLLALAIRKRTYIISNQPLLILCPNL